MSEVFQQAVWFAGAGEEDEDQEVAPRAVTWDRALIRSIFFFLRLSSPGCLSQSTSEKSIEGSK
jgi:hypothetical protein